MEELDALLAKIDALPDAPRVRRAREFVAQAFEALALEDQYAEEIAKLYAQLNRIEARGERLEAKVDALLAGRGSSEGAVVVASAPALTAEARAIALAPVRLEVDVVRDARGRIGRFNVNEV